MNRMKIKSYLTLAIAALLTLALTGCRAKRAAEAPAALSKKQRSEMLYPLAQYPADVTFVSAKTTISLDYQGHVVTMKGRLRMRQGEAVQMSITALGLMEIAVVEFTPKGAYLIDRVNKRYALIDYSSGAMNVAGVNFGAVQALFWNRLFIPGEKEAWRHAADFTIENAGEQRLVEPGRHRMLKCRFYTDMDCKQLQQTDMKLQQYIATWRYDDFEELGTYAYPTRHDVSVGGDSHAIGASIVLSGISTLDTGWQSGIDLTRYKQVDLEQLMSILNMIG